MPRLGAGPNQWRLPWIPRKEDTEEASGWPAGAAGRSWAGKGRNGQTQPVHSGPLMLCPLGVPGDPQERPQSRPARRPGTGVFARDALSLLVRAAQGRSLPICVPPPRRPRGSPRQGCRGLVAQSQTACTEEGQVTGAVGVRRGWSWLTRPPSPAPGAPPTRPGHLGGQSPGRLLRAIPLFYSSSAVSICVEALVGNSEWRSR